MHLSILHLLLAAMMTSEIWALRSLQSREEGCKSFTQVGNVYSTMGNPVPYTKNYLFCSTDKTSNPSNNNCLWKEERDVLINATLNISTSFDASILSLISSTTNTGFADLDGVANADTIGFSGLLVPAGQLGYTMLIPNVNCVEGTLDACSGGVNGSILGVQACAASTYGNIYPKVFHFSGSLAMVTTPNENARPLGDVPIQSLAGMTPTSAPASTPTGSASNLIAHWAVGLVSVCGFFALI